MLTDAQCRQSICPPGKSRARFTDAGSLYLEVAPSGSKRWFWKYLFAGAEKRLALGSYPTVTLKDARLARDAARAVQATGNDPAQQRRVEKILARTSAATTYEAVARELHKKKAPGWSDSHARQWLRCQEKDLFPFIGSLPLASITPPVLLAALERVSDRGATQMVHDLREYAGQVFSYGCQTAKASTNPARDLLGALPPHIVRHASALTTPADVGQLMRAMTIYQGQPTTRVALRLAALIFQRPGNVRMLEWSWISLEDSLLTIPAASMKRRLHGKLNGRPHLVPLATQAVAELRRIQPLTGHGRYVFPSIRSDQKPMSDNTINAALRGLGYDKTQMSGQGFRAMARTLLVENVKGIEPDVIEAQLAHSKKGSLGEAYDRAQYMRVRLKMMQQWANYLDKLAAASK